MIELDYIYLLEYDHQHVVYFSEQPGRIHYKLNGKWHYYTPDFYVERTDERLIVEVKQEEEALEEDNQRLFRIASDTCEQEGYKFVVVTDKMIRVQPRLDNIKVLTRYERVDISNPQYQIACHEFFAKRRESSLDEVAKFFTSHDVGKEVVYALIYWKILKIDLMKTLTSDSIVHLAGNAIPERKVS